MPKLRLPTGLMSTSILVARLEQGGAGQVLRAGQEGAPAAHADVPGLVGEGQLRHEQKEEEEAADAASAERRRRRRRRRRRLANEGGGREPGESEAVRGTGDGCPHQV